MDFEVEMELDESRVSLVAGHGVNNQEIQYFPNQPFTHGVKEDVSEILRQTVELFNAHKSLRITHFQEVWEHLNFGLVFII